MSNETSSISSDSIKRLIRVGWEDVHQHIALLQGATFVDTGGAEIHSGLHPEFGNIHIVVPPMGDGILLLPFAIHDF